MRVRGATGLAAAVLAIAAGTAFGADATTKAGFSGAAAPALAALEQAYPGVRTHSAGENMVYVYGVPMTAGATPDAAAEAFLAQYAATIGVNAADLELDRAHEISNGRFTIFAYKQTMNGLPVEHGVAKVLVNNALGRVVFASSKVAAAPAEAIGDPQMTGEEAIAIAGAQPSFRNFGNWTAPELVVWTDSHGRRTTEAWKFSGGHDAPGNFQWRTFFVDTTTGVLLEARDEVHTVDVSGNVQGFGTPGVRAHSGTNPPANLVMPKIRMTISGGNNAFTDSSGNYSITHGGSTAVTVTSNLSAGQWVNVNPNGVAELTVSGSVTPPGPGNFIFNNGLNVEANVAQVNAFIHTTLTHDYIKDRAPAFNAIDITIPANTGVSGSCNAFFTTSGGPSINFYNSGGGCNNTSFSSVIAHEYGHYIVNQLGLGQYGFGEGYGDTMAVMMYDVGIVGQDFTTSGGFVRNLTDGTPDWTSGSCSAGTHPCGETLGGSWYFIKEQFKTFYGTSAGLDNVRQLNVDWSMITNGADANGHGAHPGTAIEVLTVDDDNGTIDDGTPNRNRICAGFANHNITCPTLSLLAFQFPEGRPTFTTPGQTDSFPVVVLEAAGIPQPGTGKILYQVNGGSTTVLNMTETSPNNYTAVLPAVNCGDKITYTFAAQSTSAGNQVDPPTGNYQATSAYGTTVAFDDTMETNLGWTGGAAGDTATTGVWTRVNPNGTAAQPEDDHTDAPGVTAWVTGQGAVGGGVGDNDVDGGVTTLVSPAIDLSTSASALISYWRWYSNTAGAAPNADVFTVQVSNNGSTWVTVETVGPSGAETSGGWFFNQFNVSDFVAPTANVRVRFRAEDAGSGSIIEAAVDDFQVSVIDCTSPCPADVNGGGLDVTDFLDFIDSFGACEGAAAPCSGSSGVEADFNGDTSVDVLDFLDFIDAFGLGCD
jgi:hypothetical protein